MALVRRIFEDRHINPAWRSETECGYLTASVEGQTIVSLVSYGSATRQIPGKSSQNLHFDERAARELMHVLRRAFPDL